MIAPRNLAPLRTQNELYRDLHHVSVSDSSVIRAARRDENVCKVCTVWYRMPIVAKLHPEPELPLRQKEFPMANSRTDELRADLNRLLQKHTEVLESRTFGAATDTEIVEFEIRREVIQELCNQLANSSSE